MEVGPAAYVVSGAAAALQGKAVSVTEGWREYRKYEAAETDTIAGCPWPTGRLFVGLEDRHDSSYAIDQRDSSAGHIEVRSRPC